MENTAKKNLLAGLLLIMSVALLVTGIFAFFSDRGDAETSGTAGTVRITVPDDAPTTVGLDNINPGDHDWELATYLGYTDWAAAGTSIAEGSTHSISLGVVNAGNKSVKIRNTIDLAVEFVDPDFELGDDFMFFLTAEEDRTATGAAELAKKYYLFGTDVTLYFATTDGVSTAGYYTVDTDDEPVTFVAADLTTDLTPCTGIRYIVFDADPANGYILQGTGTNAEADASDGAAPDANPGYTYYLGLKAGADNRYQGATVNITWSVEAIQHRNTDATNAWQTITSLSTTGKVPAYDEAADGTELNP
jgi:hypothetical protein